MKLIRQDRFKAPVTRVCIQVGGYEDCLPAKVSLSIQNGHELLHIDLADITVSVPGDIIRALFESVIILNPVARNRFKAGGNI